MRRLSGRGIPRRRRFATAKIPSTRSSKSERARTACRRRFQQNDTWSYHKGALQSRGERGNEEESCGHSGCSFPTQGRGGRRWHAWEYSQRACDGTCHKWTGKKQALREDELIQ